MAVLFVQMRDKGKPQRSSCGDVPMSPSAPPEPSGRPKRQVCGPLNTLH